MTRKDRVALVVTFMEPHGFTLDTFEVSAGVGRLVDDRAEDEHRQGSYEFITPEEVSGLHVRGFELHGYCERSKRGHVYGYDHPEFRDVHTVCEHRARKLLKTLQTVRKRTEAIGRVHGWAVNYPQAVNRLAIALKAERVYYRRALDNEWTWFEPGSGAIAAIGGALDHAWNRWGTGEAVSNG